MKEGYYVICEAPPCNPLELAGKLAAHLDGILRILCNPKRMTGVDNGFLPFLQPMTFKNKDKVKSTSSQRSTDATSAGMIHSSKLSVRKRC